MFQDIRMPRKSLREVLPKDQPESGSKMKRARKIESSHTYHRPASHKLLWFAIVLVIIVAGGFFVSEAFSTSTIEVTPKKFEVALNSSAFTVPYESVTIPVIKEDREVTAKLGTGTPQKASGTIVIYNNYSDKPQTLVATTRFEAASGKVYRLIKAVTVPGAKSKTVAGSVEAVVVADQAGASYNAGLTDFKIPGFKGDPRYDKFSARSKTAMTGGSAGEKWKVDDAERVKVLAELKQSLLQKAAEQIRFQIPDNFVLYDSNIIPTFDEEVAQNPTGASGKAILTLSINARAIIFDREALSHALIASSLPGGSDQSFTVTNLDKLGITVDQQSLKSDDKKTTITAEGKANVELTVDQDILRSKLAGTKGSDAQKVFSEFPSILEARVSFQPPWIRSFALDGKRIKIVIP